MGQYNESLFLFWLETIFSEYLKLNSSLANTEQCFIPKVESLSYKEQVLINITLTETSMNSSKGINALCMVGSVWIVKLISGIIPMTTTEMEKNQSDIRSQIRSNTAFSTIKIVFLCIGGTVLAMFSVVVLMMRFRNCMKRRSKSYKDPYSPAPPVIYQDFDLNPRTAVRRPKHKDILWTREGDQGHIHNPSSKYGCLCTRCNLADPLKMVSNHQIYSCMPQLEKFKYPQSTEPSTFGIERKERIGSVDNNIPEMSIPLPKRRRHSLVDQIESVMNKHFDNTGIIKTTSNDNLKSKSLINSLNVSKPTTKHSVKFPNKFRKAISLRRRASIEGINRVNKIYL